MENIKKKNSKQLIYILSTQDTNNFSGINYFFLSRRESHFLKFSIIIFKKSKIKIDR